MRTTFSTLSYRIVAALAFFMLHLSCLTSPVSAQDENAAFYIYQNDGHFDAFFYDEVLKITYSKLDTLGQEYDDYVSQEIVTADSTYRIMLSAIDSIGFVQPEIIYGPQLRDMQAEGLFDVMDGWDETDNTFWFLEYKLTEQTRPKVGDILYSNDGGETLIAKVTSVESDGYTLTVKTGPVDDVKDIYKQFITIEELSHDRNGQLRARRVAGMPELNVGRFSKPRRASGNFTGDIFSFNLGGHVPLNDDVALDVNIEGGLNVKAVWNLPLIGTSYIGITTTLSAGIGVGVTVNGTITEGMVGGTSDAAAIPLPATFPLFELVLAPDCFIRGNLSAKASVFTPKMRGKVWSKLEFIDYWPYVEMGFGNPPGTSEEEVQQEAQGNTGGATFEYNGFVQTGVLFPLKLRTNKWLSKVLDCEVGTTMYVGPKLSATLSLDLANRFLGDDTFYGDYKDSKFTIALMDADYETKAKIKSFWGKEKEQTLSDGTFNLLPSTDLYLFPDFENWTETDEELSITPTRNIIFPVKVGMRIYQETEKGSKKYEKAGEVWKDAKYYQLYSPWVDNSGTISIPIEGLLSQGNITGQKYKIYPIFEFMGFTIQGNQVYELEYKPKTYFADLPDGVVEFAPNGETKTLCTIKGILDESVRIEPAHNGERIEINGRIVTMTLPKGLGIVNGEFSTKLCAISNGETNHVICETDDIHILQKPTYEVKDVLILGDGIEGVADNGYPGALSNYYPAGGGSVFQNGTYAKSASYKDMTGHDNSFKLQLYLHDGELNKDKRWNGGTWEATRTETIFKEVDGQLVWVDETRTVSLTIPPATETGVLNEGTFEGTGTLRTVQTLDGDVILDKTEPTTGTVIFVLVTE